MKKVKVLTVHASKHEFENQLNARVVEGWIPQYASYQVGNSEQSENFYSILLEKNDDAKTNIKVYELDETDYEGGGLLFVTDDTRIAEHWNYLGTLDEFITELRQKLTKRNTVAYYWIK